MEGIKVNKSCAIPINYWFMCFKNITKSRNKKSISLIDGIYSPKTDPRKV